MSGTSIDHIVSLIVFLAAMLLFVGLFNQTIQTGITYQRTSGLSEKCGDLLDTMALTPGITTSGTPSVFGVQDPEFTQYELSPFALMRLTSLTGSTASYAKTPGLTYSNITLGNNYLLTPSNDLITYSQASMLLGINGTYGFQLTLTPTIKITITEVSTNPLQLSMAVMGTGFPLANAPISYCLLPVMVNGAATPVFQNLVSNQTGTVYTDGTGSTPTLQFPIAIGPTLTYAFIAYAHLNGVTGVGFFEHSSVGTKSVIPFNAQLSAKQVIVAHSDDVPNNSPTSDVLYYNSTFIFVNQNYALQQTSPGSSSNQYGTVISSAGYPIQAISMSSYNPGILVIAYSNNGNGGVVMMPWGLSSLGFPISFGVTHTSQEKVVTDLRQVQVNGVSYQAELSLWSLQGFQVNGQ